MKIGIDANEANLTNNRVGINQYAFDLLHAIYNLNSEDEFIIYLKTPPKDDLPKPRHNWKYRVIPFPKFWTQTRLPIDLFFHKPRPEVFLSLTHYAPRFSVVPSVVTIMDLGFMRTPDQFTKSVYNQLKSWTSYSVKQAKKVIAISEFTKNDLIKLFNIPPSNISVSYPSYDSTLFKKTLNRDVLDKYKIDQPYILFLSSLKPSKNIEGLIKAFSEIRDKNISLVISGKKGWLFDSIFNLVKQLKLENKIIFTGFVEEQEVPVLMSMSKCFVMPSFYEGFGIPVLEAMACETPVVVSNVASLPEVAGEAGIYVDPLNIESIRQGIENAISQERGKFVKAGLKRVKLFSWDKTAQEVISTVKSIQ